MAVQPITGPSLFGTNGGQAPVPRSYYLHQSPSFRESDFLALVTTGTINTPSPQGGLATATGPSLGQNFNLPNTSASLTVGNVAITATGSGAPTNAVSYYVQLTYCDSGSESIPGAEFILNCAGGVLPIVNVTTAGGTGAGHYSPYIGLFSGGEARQVAALTTQAINSAFTFPSPLTNNIGINQAATNQSGSIVGIAMADAEARYARGVGGAANVGGPGNLLGYWANPSPLGPPDPLQMLVQPLINGQLVSINLKQAWYPSLIGTTAGLLIDPTSGYFVLDNSQSNKIATIVGMSQLAGSVTSPIISPGDTYVRVNAVFSASAVI